MVANYPEFWGAAELELWDSYSGGRESDFREMSEDPQALALFSAGWLEDGYTNEERNAIRDEFFDYAIEEGYFYDREDFDWQEWRDYMGY